MAPHRVVSAHGGVKVFHRLDVLQPRHGLQDGQGLAQGSFLRNGLSVRRSLAAAVVPLMFGFELGSALLGCGRLV